MFEISFIKLHTVVGMLLYIVNLYQPHSIKELTLSKNTLVKNMKYQHYLRYTSDNKIKSKNNMRKNLKTNSMIIGK